MGFSFGGIIIDHDFTQDVRKAQGLALDKVSYKVILEACLAALREIDVEAFAEDLLIDFSEATKNRFWDYAVATVNGKTLIINKFLGTVQESGGEVFKRCSKRGAVLAFHIDDGSGTYMFSLYRDGERVRYRSFGHGLSDDEGALLPGEPMEVGAEKESGDTTQGKVINAFLGQELFSLFELEMVHLKAKDDD